jgi:hypothetical protein
MASAMSPALSPESHFRFAAQKPTFERAPDIVGVGQQQNISPLARTCKISLARGNPRRQ